MRNEIRLAGFGGQGLALAGYILGKAATLYDGKEAVLTQSYGPEARGGASSADLIIADELIDYPVVTAPNYLVIMSREAFSTFADALAPGGTMVLDSTLVSGTTEGGILLEAPFTQMAEELGRRIVANIVMLGFLVGATGIVSKEALEEAVRTTMSAKVVELNLRAFDLGFQRAQSREVVR